jgi:predicted ATPase
VGAPGIGKTRLSIEVAGRPDTAEQFEDGVFMVELAPITDRELVIPTIATTLGLKETGGQSQSLEAVLLQYLQDKRMLLVLDNFEQVLDAAPGVVGLLARSPWLKVLVTSREALHVRGERRFHVPPLELSDLPTLVGTATGTAGKPTVHTMQVLSVNPAVALFVERARGVVPDFELTQENAADLAAVCVGLDGLPLAIELAAAQVDVLSARQMKEGLGSRLKLLTKGARDLPARQRTLQAAIEWSYDLLGEEEQRLFRRMAVFRGGRTFEALREVCNYDEGLGLDVDVQNGAEKLAGRSLLELRRGRGGEARFWMLETIHEYAREKLRESGEAPALQREHALYFMALAEEAEPDLMGPRQQEWLDRLGDEYDNIRAALDWAGEHSKLGVGARNDGAAVEQAEQAAEVGLRLAGALWHFWMVKSLFTEGVEHLRRLLELTESEASTQGPPSSISSTMRSRSTIRAKALNTASDLVFRQSDFSSAQSLATAALILGREVGDKQSMAWSLHSLALVALLQGDYTTARSKFEESLALMREIGDKWGIAAALSNRGLVALYQGDYTTARSLIEESLALMREIGDKWAISHFLMELGVVAKEQRDYTAARSLLEESLVLKRELGDKVSVGLSLTYLGGVAKEQRDYTAARSLLEESLVLKRELGDKWGIANSLANLGTIAMEQGDHTAARSLLVESLVLRRELGDRRGIAASLAGLGGVTIRGAVGVESVVAVGREGEVERGARLLGAAEGLLQSTGAALDREDREPYEWSVQEARSLLGEEAFVNAWQEGRAMSMEAAIDYALGDTGTTGTHTQP